MTFDYLDHIPLMKYALIYTSISSASSSGLWSQTNTRKMINVHTMKGALGNSKAVIQREKLWTEHTVYFYTVDVKQTSMHILFLDWIFYPKRALINVSNGNLEHFRQVLRMQMLLKFPVRFCTVLYFLNKNMNLILWLLQSPLV